MGASAGLSRSITHSRTASCLSTFSRMSHEQERITPRTSPYICISSSLLVRLTLRRTSTSTQGYSAECARPRSMNTSIRRRKVVRPMLQMDISCRSTRRTAFTARPARLRCVFISGQSASSCVAAYTMGPISQVPTQDIEWRTPEVSVHHVIQFYQAGCLLHCCFALCTGIWRTKVLAYLSSRFERMGVRLSGGATIHCTDRNVNALHNSPQF